MSEQTKTRIELIEIARQKVIENGGSLYVLLPKLLKEQHNLKPGDIVTFNAIFGLSTVIGVTFDKE